ncbi:MAG: N-6 DNA methylase [Verrucomicrobia bacterium]|nr:N-6 DNA methylase [Verrucomicrobiota bacterium]
MSAGRTNTNQFSTDWCTPPKYVKVVSLFFDNQIDLDPCSNEFSIIKAKTSYSLPEKDGLQESWNYKNIFVNPPYGADRVRGTTIRDWIRKCQNANEEFGSEVLALVPVATNTRHWKDYIFGKAAGICFLYDTRLRFSICGHLDEKGAPMSCAMIYWGSNIKRFIEIFSEYGAALDITGSINMKFGKRELMIQPSFQGFDQHKNILTNIL